MKKRVLSMILAIVMVVGWIPAMTLGAGAAATAAVFTETNGNATYDSAADVAYGSLAAAIEGAKEGEQIIVAYGYHILSDSELVCDNIVRIEGGHLTVNAGTFNERVYANLLGAAASLTINGGSFNGSVEITKTMTVTGGTFNGEVKFRHAENVSLEGGSFLGTMIISGDTNLTVTGGTYNAEIYEKISECVPDDHQAIYDAENDTYGVQRTPVFEGASVSIGEDLSVDYYLLLPLGCEPSDYSVRFTMNSKVETIVLDAANEVANDEYKVTYTGIAPQQMADNIKAELLFGEEVVAVKDEYSVRANAVALLVEYPNDEALNQLLVDMLAYGAAAQNYQDYHVENPANKDLYEGYVPSTARPEASEKVLTEALSENVYFTAATMWFDYQNSIVVKISTAENAALYVDGKKVELDGTAYCTESLLATELDKTFTFELYEGEELVQTLVYSAEDYVYAMMDKTENGEPTEMAELALALYNYCQSAAAYLAA